MMRAMREMIGVSPRLRGWTHPVHHRGRPARGLPAPAGMDPSMVLTVPAPRGSPRACGDGPRDSRRRVVRRPVSPRLRGWTRRLVVPLRMQVGLPAPAGMDRGRALRAGDGRRSPRACGDGPYQSGARRVSRPSHGLPAPAGMDPVAVRRRRVASGSPRACGDGPLTVEEFVGLSPVSPRLRGWTRSRHADSGRL